jgi:hypothetical protein
MSVIDAVGMEAHGAPVGKLAHRIAGMLPDASGAPMTEEMGIDRLGGLARTIDGAPPSGVGQPERARTSAQPRCVPARPE